MNELNTTVVTKPDPEAGTRLDACLDLLAEALAARFVEDARAEVAHELGVPAEQLELPDHASSYRGRASRWEVGA